VFGTKARWFTQVNRRGMVHFPIAGPAGFKERYFIPSERFEVGILQTILFVEVIEDDDLFGEDP